MRESVEREREVETAFKISWEREIESVIVRKRGSEKWCVHVRERN